MDDVEKTSEHQQDQKKKTNKLLTKVERLKRGRDNHPILNGCNPISSHYRKGCTENCTETISNKRRNQIHEYNWSLTKDSQKIWISHMVEIITPISPRKKNTRNKERIFTSIYHLEYDKGEKVRVCQKTSSLQSFWLQIKQLRLCYQKVEVPGQMIYLIKGEKLNLLRKKKKGETSDLVKHYIVGYKLSISHYRRSHAQRVVYFSRA